MRSENAFQVEVYEETQEAVCTVPPNHRIVKPPACLRAVSHFWSSWSRPNAIPFSTSENLYWAISCLSDDEYSINTNLPSRLDRDEEIDSRDV